MNRCLAGLFTVTVAMAILTLSVRQASADETMSLRLRYQKESSANSGRFHHMIRNEKWKASETAMVVCDVWDLHHCLNAVRRLEEFAPRLNEVLTKARAQGVTIIHSPSDCMPAYQKHPARRRAVEIAVAANLPHDVKSWCSLVPAEERTDYPIDQSDGGCDDDPEEHAVWAAKLEKLGRNPGTPWGAQSELIQIDGERDFISDRGDEVWSILEARGIRNVILTGVHTNMCVLGRPFGLRQMARNGKRVVLMRDMTDTMYNPKRWPYVSHFTGTDLIVSHIERHVCPTISSDQFIGGDEFRFRNDKRPLLVMVMAEDGYETNRTLPDLAAKHLGRDFRVTTVFGSDTDRNAIPGLYAVDQADLLLLSVRRRVLPPADLDRIRKFVEAGKPVIGIRTASHAFSLGKKAPPEGLKDWPEFDRRVFGGNYHGHHANSEKTAVTATNAGREHTITANFGDATVKQGAVLYKTSPLSARTRVLLEGVSEDGQTEPVMWTFQRSDGGRSLYSSMGHPQDLADPRYRRTLLNAIYWAANVNAPRTSSQPSGLAGLRRHWTVQAVPFSGKAVPSALNGYDGAGWFRCVAVIPKAWTSRDMAIQMHGTDGTLDVWCNGHQLAATQRKSATVFEISKDFVYADDANLLVVRVANLGASGALKRPPVMRAGSEQLTFAGRWQFRIGDNPALANMPLPAKFGAPTDIVFAPQEPLWTARPLTQIGQFTSGIEGPACDPEGNVYAVNFDGQGTIGRVRPNGVGEVFVRLPPKSVGNGIRFGHDGDHFFVADYPRHNVLRVDLKSRKVTVYAHDDAMNQPNDLAIAPNGVLFASDPAWSKGDGQLWRIDTNGKVTRLAANMGTTNGIEVSPDGGTLYVNESVQRNIWAFTIETDGSISKKRLVRRFADFGFDGMRCDVDGNLYVTRHGKGTVVKLSPSGKTLQEIEVLGAHPTNICFGGPDGRTAYVTEAQNTRLVTFRVDRPGRSWRPE
jgi:sugar lactone lactonase YvrE/nicotinamidase-related amidase/type 1 glutamine amidotransferase